MPILYSIHSIGIITYLNMSTGKNPAIKKDGSNESFASFKYT